MKSDIKEIFKKDRFKDYIYGEESFVFQEKFYNKDIDCVQLIHYEHGFCGEFMWRGNAIYPLDGDSYANKIVGFGYQHFIDRIGRQCLNVVVGDEW